MQVLEWTVKLERAGKTLIEQDVKVDAEWNADIGKWEITDIALMSLEIDSRYVYLQQGEHLFCAFKEILEADQELIERLNQDEFHRAEYPEKFTLNEEHRLAVGQVM